ncbi:MAG: peptidylprolyl isomerase [Acholeplasmatales bacterium]|nr:peptidylprolyl isomerase [Acholeplasmatales bacterium]
MGYYKNFNEFLSNDNPRVRLSIKDFGTIELELFASVAPKTCENFLQLVDKKFYDGLIFHRIIKGFMIQGGDPDGTGMGGSDEKIVGEFVKNGFKNLLSHSRGVISMARTNDPNSASSQFFICDADDEFLDGSYASFGAVVSGLDTLDKVASVKTNGNDRPLTDVVIENIVRIK